MLCLTINEVISLFFMTKLSERASLYIHQAGSIIYRWRKLSLVNCLWTLLILSAIASISIPIATTLLLYWHVKPKIIGCPKSMVVDWDPFWRGSQSTSPKHPVEQTVPVDQATTYSPLYLQKDAYFVPCGVYVQIHMHMYTPAFFLQKAAESSLFTRDKRQE